MTLKVQLLAALFFAAANAARYLGAPSIKHGAALSVNVVAIVVIGLWWLTAKRSAV